MPQPHPAVTLSIRINPKSRDKLEALANATGRSKSFLASEAVDYYLGMHAWQVDAIKKSVKKANSKKAKFVKHEQMSEWLNSWGDKNEKDPPK